MELYSSFLKLAPLLLLKILAKGGLGPSEQDPSGYTRTDFAGAAVPRCGATAS